MNEVPPVPSSVLERALDTIIGLVSPRAAAERVAYRTIEHEIRASLWRGAQSSRLDRPAARGGSPNRDLLSTDRHAMVWRARQLERSSAVAESLLDRDVDNVIGIGFRPQARSSSKEWNKRAEGLFADWGEQEADSRGLDSFGGLQRLFYRSKKRDGDAGFLLNGDGTLRIVESDEIVSPARGVAMPNMVDGVELDGRGRPLAFWLADEGDVSGLNPGYRPGLGRVRIPTSDFVFSARRKRAGQTRGVSGFNNTSWLFESLDQHIEAVLAAARMAACLGIIHEKKTRMTGLQTRQDEDGSNYQQFKLQPGAYLQVGLGEKVTQLEPGRPVQNLPELLRLIGRLVGLPFNAPLELVFLDFSQGNYAQARGVMLQAWQGWRCEQADQRRCAGAVWRWKIQHFMRTGKLRERSDWNAHRWLCPGWQWIDPTTELDADLLAVDAGMSTLAEVVAKTGRDLEEIAEQRADEIKMFERLKLPIPRSPRTRDPVAPAEQPKKTIGPEDPAPAKRPAVEDPQDEQDQEAA